jgi:hypothetical protein
LEPEVASLEEILISRLSKPAMVTSVSVTNLHEGITMELCSSFTVVLATEENLRSSVSGDGGVLASFSLGASSWSTSEGRFVAEETVFERCVHFCNDDASIKA